MCQATQPDVLNTCYACFDLLSKDLAVKSTSPPENRPLSVITADVRKIRLRVNINKVAGADNVPDRVLKTCAEQ